MISCIFCKIASHQAEAIIDHEDEQAVAFRSINPVAEYHVIITPRAHIETFMDIKLADKYLNHMAVVAQKLIKSYKIENGYKLAFNGGKYQEVPHLHWHLLGGEFFNLNDPLNNT